jgi:hypothetical protein
MSRRLLDQGKESGELRPEVNRGTVTEMVLSGMSGASVIHGTEKSPAGLNRCINALTDYLDSLAP